MFHDVSIIPTIFHEVPIMFHEVPIMFHEVSIMFYKVFMWLCTLHRLPPVLALPLHNFGCF